MLGLAKWGVFHRFDRGKHKKYEKSEKNMEKCLQSLEKGFIMRRISNN